MLDGFSEPVVLNTICGNIPAARRVSGEENMIGNNINRTLSCFNESVSPESSLTVVEGPELPKKVIAMKKNVIGYVQNASCCRFPFLLSPPISQFANTLLQGLCPRILAAFE